MQKKRFVTGLATIALAAGVALAGAGAAQADEMDGYIPQYPNAEDWATPYTCTHSHVQRKEVHGGMTYLVRYEGHTSSGKYHNVNMKAGNNPRSIGMPMVKRCH
ncbi:hypothetical protein [Pengzhenrongella sp.]|jgi:hypothetical protein|uniref:hypothetical protein n=1 Tax=Pengzhenrongella sp. TaxID=2888820 RepID=UPI002F949D12